MDTLPVCASPVRADASRAGKRRLPVRRMAAAVTGLVALLGLAVSAQATVLNLPTDGSTVVGKPHVVVIPPDSKVTLLDIGRHFDVGYRAMVNANPHTSVWLPGTGTHVLVPSRFILPPKPWKGIVINIPQRRLFYFPPKKKGQPRKVITFPVGIFQKGFPDPLGKTRIIAEFRDPKWVVPEDIRKQAEKEGRHLPHVVPPGPNNPMGELALETGFSEIFIHGTSKPWGVGMRPSHGCFHLFPENARTAFKHVPVGTPVRTINDPMVVGRDAAGHIVFSVFPALEAYKKKNTMTAAINLITNYVVHHGDQAQIDWLRVKREIKAKTPLPVSISQGSPSLRETVANIKPIVYRYPPYTNANNGTPPPRQKPIGESTASNGNGASAASSNATASTASSSGSKVWTVRVAAFAKSKDAVRMITRLEKRFQVDAFQSLTEVRGTTFHRVFVGHLKSQDAATKLANKLSKALGHSVTVSQID